jgi:hypothetical protein
VADSVNLVLPAAGNSGEEAVSFTRLLFGLTALALERFDAARENHCQDAPGESVPPCLAGVPVDPFGGQLLRSCQADDGYQLHSAGHNATATLVAERDLGD